MIDLVEGIIEIINLVIALVMTFFGLGTIKKLEGDLKTAARFLLFSVLLFGIHELVGVLEEFNLLVIEDLYFISELLFIVAFFCSIIYFKRLFDKLSETKGGKR